MSLYLIFLKLNLKNGFRSNNFILSLSDEGGVFLTPDPLMA